MTETTLPRARNLDLEIDQDRFTREINTIDVPAGRPTEYNIRDRITNLRNAVIHYHSLVRQLCGRLDNNPDGDKPVNPEPKPTTIEASIEDIYKALTAANDHLSTTIQRI